MAIQITAINLQGTRIKSESSFLFIPALKYEEGGDDRYQ
jgi:hypothetical protein